MPTTQLDIHTRDQGLHDITPQVARALAEMAVAEGLCVVFVRHTSASLIIQENADPSAAADLLAWLERLAPRGDHRYEHTAEGPDDMPSHLRSAVTRTSETVPVSDGDLALGTWQGIYLLEHRDVAHTRNLIVHVLGE